MDLVYEKNRRMELRRTLKFKSTNEIWNTLCLNQSWCIGYLTKLFKTKHFKNHSEWESFYYNSGQLRLEKINKLPKSKQSILNNFKINATDNSNLINSLEKRDININKYSGRTEQELCEIGKYMYDKINETGNKMCITLDECIDFVKIRVIDEISIGIEREINTINKLKSFYPNLTFKEVPVEFDAKYCVDYEVYKNQKLILALQIKSDKYRKGTSAIMTETKSFNIQKNKNYKAKYGIDVMYIYSKQNGFIEDFASIKNISNYIN